MPEGLQHMPGWEQMPQTAQDNATGLAADGNPHLLQQEAMAQNTLDG